MDELNKDRPINLTGNIEADLSSMLQTSFGEETTEYLAQWTTISQLSLKANRLKMKRIIFHVDFAEKVSLTGSKKMQGNILLSAP